MIGDSSRLEKGCRGVERDSILIGKMRGCCVCVWGGPLKQLFPRLYRLNLDKEGRIGAIGERGRVFGGVEETYLIVS